MTAHPDRHHRHGQLALAAPEPRPGARGAALAPLRGGAARSCDSARSSERKGQVGSGDRSERIRTYNFPQGRVTDHRINLTLYKLDKVLSGEALDEVVDALIADDQARKLSEFEDACVTTYGEALAEGRGSARSEAASKALRSTRGCSWPRAAGLDMAALIARSDDELPGLADAAFKDHLSAGDSRRAGGAHFWRDRILGPPVQAQRGNAGAAPRDRDAGRGCA